VRKLNGAVLDFPNDDESYQNGASLAPTLTMRKRPKRPEVAAEEKLASAK
jgi:hypothetical protein